MPVNGNTFESRGNSGRRMPERHLCHQRRAYQSPRLSRPSAHCSTRSACALPIGPSSVLGTVGAAPWPARPGRRRLRLWLREMDARGSEYRWWWHRKRLHTGRRRWLGGTGTPVRWKRRGPNRPDIHGTRLRRPIRPWNPAILWGEPGRARQQPFLIATQSIPPGRLRLDLVPVDIDPVHRRPPPTGIAPITEPTESVVTPSIRRVRVSPGIIRIHPTAAAVHIVGIIIEVRRLTEPRASTENHAHGQRHCAHGPASRHCVIQPASGEGEISIVRRARKQQWLDVTTAPRFCVGIAGPSSGAVLRAQSSGLAILPPRLPSQGHRP